MGEESPIFFVHKIMYHFAVKFHLRKGPVKTFKLIFLFCLVAFSISEFQAYAAGLTDKQIEQFKSLPKQQQELLAKQYGLNLDELKLQANDGAQLQQQELTQLNQIKPEKDEEQAQTLEEKFKPKEDELEPFGYELFDSNTSILSPSTNTLIPDDYIVGPGDFVHVSLYGKESDDLEIEINREGKLQFQGLSPIQVAGLQFQELKSLIKDKVTREMLGVSAYVAMGRLRGIRVMVMGEVQNPGSYTVSALSSITHALFASGGVSKIGSLRNIQVKRAGKTVHEFDLYDLLVFGDNRNDVLLNSGDVVFVPPVGRQVSVSGQVKRPAIFELKQGESAKDLVEMAGGLKAEAFPKRTIVERFKSNSFKTVIQLDLSKESISYEPKDGDKIQIPESSYELENAITLLGAVTYPGNYDWQAGIKVSDLVGNINTDLLPYADYHYALVIRTEVTGEDVKVFQFSPLNASKGLTNEDLELAPRDVVMIFSRFEIREEESSALTSLALTEKQLQLKDKKELWAQYEQQKFLEFIDPTKALEERLKNSVESEQEETSSLQELLFADEKDLDDGEKARFGRNTLLLPLIARLTQQASVGNELKVFAITGEVKKPGVYPLPENISIAKAIEAAGGLKESAFLGNAEITRVFRDMEAKVEHLSIDLREEFSGVGKTTLHSKDTLNILPLPNWQEEQTIKLVGEVRFPGVYTIKKGELLSSVIKRAGGLKDSAFIGGTIFTRESIRLQEKQQLKKLAEDLRRDIASRSFQNSVTDSSLSYADMDKLLKDLSKIEALGRLVINIRDVLDGTLDIEVKNQDTLYIPQRQNTVSVIGEVNVSTSHLYRPDVSLEDYIELSGGYKQRADEKRIYVIKANGSVVIPKSGGWFSVNKSSILDEGDTIVVPLDSEYMDSLSLWSTATQILYQTGVAVAAIASL